MSKTSKPVYYVIPVYTDGKRGRPRRIQTITALKSLLQAFLGYDDVASVCVEKEAEQE